MNRKRPNRSAGLVFGIRLALAVGLSLLAFWVVVYPTAKWVGWSVTQIAWRVLDAPASTLNLLLPYRWRSAAAFQFANTPSPAYVWWELLRYLRVSIPAYLGLIYAFAFIAHLFRSRIRMQLQDDAT